MAKQSDLIGNHPAQPNIFERWLACTDVKNTPTKCHRSLVNSIPANDAGLIDWLAERLVHHHYDEERLERLKQKYRDVGFAQYAEQNRRLPRADKTKKGNATEILLIEYIESCQNKPLVKAYKLRYNPNVDQAIKGDDTLLVDTFKDANDKDEIRVFLGEAKFRKTSSKTVVESISKSLSKDKKPLSYSFLVDELNRSDKTKKLADLLDQFIIEEVKNRGNLIYTGFLLSDANTFKVVEANLSSNNPSLVFISTGIDAPEGLINEAFKKAEALLTPKKP